MQIGVIGSHKSATRKSKELAYLVGKEIAGNKATLVCGGLGGVMEAACRGAKDNGGTTVGILPGEKHGEANRYVDVVLPTGLGHRRNSLVVMSSHGVIAVQGEVGTLSEMCYAWMYDKPIVVLRGSGGYSDVFAGKTLDEKHKWVIGYSKSPGRAVKKLIALIEERCSIEE
ncbi:MAG: TIGR00725 family protein [Candidatus Micrarchaeota archaeon]